MGSSAQISSGVCRCGSQEQIPERGSGRFRGSSVCGCRFQRQVPEGSGGFRRVPARAGEGSGGRFRRVPVRAGVGSGGRVRKVLESSGAATLTGTAMWLFWTLAGDHIVHMGKATTQKNGPYSQTWHKDSYAVYYIIQLLGIPPKLIYYSPTA